MTREAGLSRKQIQHRVQTNVLVRLLADTYLIEGAPRTVTSKFSAATLAVTRARLSGGAAAHVLGLPDIVTSTRPEVVTAEQARHEVPGLVIHRSADLLDRHCTRVDGIPTTTIPRTVIDLATTHSLETIGSVVDDLLRTHQLHITRLHDELDRIGRRGRRGTSIMRRVVDQRVAGRVIAPTVLERMGRSFLRDHGFDDPVIEFVPIWGPGTIARVDLAYPERRLVIELDGRKWHDRSDAFEHDRLRDQIAAAAGWMVVRVTWRQLTDDPVGLAQRLALTIEQRAA